MNWKYNSTEANSIIEHAYRLLGKTLRDIIDSDLTNYEGKGSFGQLVEQYHFGYSPNSNAEADFPEAGIELKCSPLKELKRGGFNSKERLVLNIINYMDTADESFEVSSFWKKNQHLLLIFYLFEKDKDVLDLLVKLVGDWEFPEEDLRVIKHDWNTIQNKILEGKAHELSEGDTFYLGACTKGANSIKSYRQQPNSDIPAKQRAFSLKQGYVNHIIHNLAHKAHNKGQLKDMPTDYGKRISTKINIKPFDIEERILHEINKFKGMNSKQIVHELNLQYDPKSTKHIYPLLVRSILNSSDETLLEAINKSEITVKTIRVEESNRIRESISFPAFKFEEMYNSSWLHSNMIRYVEKRFLFVFFKKDGKHYKLEKALFWNMPYEDRNEVRRVWLNTKRIIQQGRIVHQIKTNSKGQRIRSTNFPKKTESYVAHVRPHGRDAMDTYPLPVKDQVTKANGYTKQCFWLNWDYVRDEIYLKF